MTTISENIHIAILGPVSAGKSTLFNAICSNTCSDMKRRKTTMLPQIYHATNDIGKVDSIETIYAKNKTSNDRILELRENGQFNIQKDFKEINHNISFITEFINLPDSNATYSILDMPGLNCGVDNIYNNYIINNSDKIDIYLLVFDINSGMNTTDEINIINLVVSQIKKNANGYIHFLINKCDSIKFLPDNKINLGEDELHELYNRSIGIIHKQCSEIAGKYTITPICSSKLYIYRGVKNNIDNIDEYLLDNIIIEQCGKPELKKLNDVGMKRRFISGLFQQEDMYNDWMTSTGYNLFIKQLNNYITNNYTSIIYYHINKEIVTLNNKPFASIDVLINQINSINDRIKNVKRLSNDNIPITIIKNLEIINTKLNKHIIAGVDSYSGSTLDIVNSSIGKINQYYSLVINIFQSNPLQQSKQTLEEKRNRLLETKFVQNFDINIFTELYKKNLLPDNIIRSSINNKLTTDISLFNQIIEDILAVNIIDERIFNIIILEYIKNIQNMKFDFSIFKKSLEIILNLKKNEIQLISNLIKIYFNNNLEPFILNYWFNLNYSNIFNNSIDVKYIYLNLSHQTNINYFATSVIVGNSLENYSPEDFKRDFTKLDIIYETIKNKYEPEVETINTNQIRNKIQNLQSNNLESGLGLVNNVSSNFSPKIDNILNLQLKPCKNPNSETNAEYEEYNDSDDSQLVYKKAIKNASTRANDICSKGL